MQTMSSHLSAIQHTSSHPMQTTSSHLSTSLFAIAHMQLPTSRPAAMEPLGLPSIPFMPGKSGHYCLRSMLSSSCSLVRAQSQRSGLLTMAGMPSWQRQHHRCKSTQQGSPHCISVCQHLEEAPHCNCQEQFPSSHPSRLPALRTSPRQDASSRYAMAHRMPQMHPDHLPRLLWVHHSSNSKDHMTRSRQL